MNWILQHLFKLTLSVAPLLFFSPGNAFENSPAVSCCDLAYQDNRPIQRTCYYCTNVRSYRPCYWRVNSLNRYGGYAAHYNAYYHPESFYYDTTYLPYNQYPYYNYYPGICYYR